MTRMTGPDCVVMCNLINTHTHTHQRTQLTIVTNTIERDFVATAILSFDKSLQTFSTYTRKERALRARVRFRDMSR